MSWCPNCKTEYVSGIEICNECSSKLVDLLDKEENNKRKEYKVALIIKLFAGLFFILGFGYSMYTAIDYWIRLKGVGQLISSGLPFQQFITMLGRSIYSSLILFALGEGLQILHDIKIKINSK